MVLLMNTTTCLNSTRQNNTESKLSYEKMIKVFDCQHYAIVYENFLVLMLVYLESSSRSKYIRPNIEYWPLVNVRGIGPYLSRVPSSDWESHTLLRRLCVFLYDVFLHRKVHSKFQI